MSSIDTSIGPDRARELFRAELAEVRTDAELQALRTRWVGRNNSWSAAFMEALKTATPELKKTLGKGANELKKEAEAAIAERKPDANRHRRPAEAPATAHGGEIGAVAFMQPKRGGQRHRGAQAGQRAR